MTGLPDDYGRIGLRKGWIEEIQRARNGEGLGAPTPSPGTTPPSLRVTPTWMLSEPWPFRCIWSLNYVGQTDLIIGCWRLIHPSASPLPPPGDWGSSPWQERVQIKTWSSALFRFLLPLLFSWHPQAVFLPSPPPT